MSDLLPLAGPVATIIAAIAAVIVTGFIGRGQLRIARQQATTARQQVKLAEIRLQHDLYDRRFGIYSAAREFVFKIEREAHASDDALLSYIRDTLDAVFLFDESVISYLEGIRKRASQLRHAALRLKDLPPSTPERAQAVDAEMAIISWFQEQPPILIEKFMPFLGLGRTINIDNLISDD